MFNNKQRRINELEKIIDNLNEKIKKLESEKEELLLLKNEFLNKSKKISNTNIFVVKINNYYRIAELEVVKLGYKGDCQYSILTDIFSQEIIYEKSGTLKITEWHDKFGKFITIIPVYEFDSTLLDYPNNEIPIYVLKKLYYSLNDIKTLVKNKES